MISNELLKSYHATIYTTNTPNAFHIKIGERNTALNEYLAANKFESWAYITAENPFSKKLIEAENNVRNEKLEKEINQKGFSYLAGKGIPESMEWTPENSFLILNISLNQARMMARDYHQNAFVFGSLTVTPELIILMPSK